MRLVRNRLYYALKPWVPAGTRMALRRWHSRRRWAQSNGDWPILPGSETPPAGWKGWPEGKQFAVVLTHDVEGPLGLNRCRRVMEIERELGFRSSFNLIPEGSYEVPQALREDLTSHGFEVGVHDLHHDGKLYSSYRAFVKSAERINHYLREWNAVGFRSGFMLHNLEWAHHLNIQYEASTFDTDPFEPQPDGVGTIFPFWVAQPSAGRTTANAGYTRAGYVEMPYTLVQDSTLFLFLGERRLDLWFQKLDWVARHGGMVLVDTHPDYQALDPSEPTSWEYPVGFYTQLLDYIRSKHAGTYWHVTASELAKWYVSTLPGEALGNVMNAGRGPAAVEWSGREGRALPPEREGAVSAGPCAMPVCAKPGRAFSQIRPKIWIDLDNTPHVPFFEPILDELRARGFPVLVTARDAFQVCALADSKGINYLRIGRHYGKHMLLKGAGLIYRSLQMIPVVLREKPKLAVSHGARSQILLCNLLRLPSILIEDYEHCKFAPMAAPSWLMAPDVIPDSALQRQDIPVRKYAGIKEDVYAWKLRPDFGLLKALGLNETDLVLTVRPPATEAHYHNPESERLFAEVMRLVTRNPATKMVLLPRNQAQGEVLRRQFPECFGDGRTIIPNAAIDGMNLIWHSDLVVSGGGTMNREAAALGVPVYSIFRGTLGAVDRQLAAEGRLELVESVEDVSKKIKLVKRARRPLSDVTSRRTLLQVVDMIQEIAETCRG